MNIGSTVGSVMQTSATALPPLAEDVQKSAKQVNQTAIQRPVEGVQSVVENMTDMKQGQQESDANARLVRASDDALGSLINTEA